ncbi:MAG: hypothetical protein KDF60_16295 [Calditrichaeota bacterium]|nr:hypothetical protein [Calditrichota bacterium]
MKPPKEKKLAKEDHPLAAWFLGPKGEHSETWSELFHYIFDDYVYWRRNYFPQDPIVIDRMRRREHEPWFDYMTSNLDNILNDLKAHFPFYSPRYIAHMLSEQTLPGVLGYFAGMLYNPNNVTDEAAPVTVRLELEVGRMIAKMIGYNPEKSWAHICSGGTVANIEALWVARMVQFIPLMVNEFVNREKIPFMVNAPNGESVKISDLSPMGLLHLKTDEAISMIKNLARFMILDLGRSTENVLPLINKSIHTSEFNPAHRGLFSILQKLNLQPKIFVSSTAHYSINKAANILGYGENNVVTVDVDARFRMRTDVLHELIANRKNSEYTVAVIAVMGTTEEGAVDPLKQVIEVREKVEKELNQSFWLHADAAWGGYVRSLFCGDELPQDAETEEIIKVLNVSEEYDLKISDPQSETITTKIAWDNPLVYDAFLSMHHADSVTVDPHKMGYIPYPAGIIVFKNGLVTDLLAHKAQYISDIREGISSLGENEQIHAIGPYILEGSKPGAAAAACWLSHKTIPLEMHGHGKIIRTTLLNARKLANNLKSHKRFFTKIEDEISAWEKHGEAVSPFTFFPLYRPDTNIVCFIATAMAWVNGELQMVDKDLSWINTFNERVYQHLTISGADLGFKPPYAQPYFVSRTRFDEEQYRYSAIKEVLQPFNISRQQYEKEGLFVLRATVMNPLYYLSEQEGKNYLLDFVKYLHLVTRDVINEMFNLKGKQR